MKTKAKKTLAAAPEILMSIEKEIGLTFPRLPLTSKLGDALKTTYGAQAELYTGMKAKKDLLFKKSMKDFRYIVFPTHGYFGTDFQ